MLISGKKLQQELLESLAESVKKLKFTPIVYDIVSSVDPVSEKFVKIKQDTASSIGIEFRVKRADGEVSEEEFQEVIDEICAIPEVCGVIVQLPIPKHLDKGKILSMVPPELDVDCLNPLNIWWESGKYKFTPPVAAAVEHILSSVETDQTKQVVVVGRGNLVGVPTIKYLTKKGWTAVSLDSSSPNWETTIKEADVLITGVGKPGLIRGEHIKPGAVVIDAGTSESGGKIQGDVDTSSVEPVAKVVSPVPGGVGPLTVAMLLKNVLLSAKKKKQAVGKNTLTGEGN